MDYYTLPDATGIKPRHFHALLWGLCGLAVLYTSHLAVEIVVAVSNSPARQVAEAPDQYQLGGHTLSVPEPYLKTSDYSFFERSGTSSARQRLELAVVWPTMTPASRTRSAQMSLGNGSNLVHLDIKHEKLVESLSEQIEPMFQRLATTPAIKGPAGLNVLTLSPSAGMERDEIIYESQSSGHYAARCKKPKGSKQAICERSFEVGGELTVTYQFEKPLLANWGRLERRTRELVEAAILQSEKPVATMKKASPTG